MAQPGMPGPAVENNMTMSIVSIFFFWPLAIPAIINASKVDTLLRAGDFAGAQAASAESKKWSKWALIIGIGWWVVALIGCCALGALGNMFNN